MVNFLADPSVDVIRRGGFEALVEVTLVLSWGFAWPWR